MNLSPQICTRTVWRQHQGEAPDRLAEESPVAIRFSGHSHAVMMCTPSDLEDFVRGFAVTEGVIAEPSQLTGIQVSSVPEHGGIVIDADVPAASLDGLKQRQRSMEGRTGCGVCGARTLEAMQVTIPMLSDGCKLSLTTIRSALEWLEREQPLNQMTGATHAAAWASVDGTILAVREDVGRHNALDKLVGHLLAKKLDLQRGFAVITSRASFEMVQKAGLAGICTLVAVSAPTALAVRLAEQCGMSLVGFARPERQVVYAGRERIRDCDPAVSAA